MMTIDINDIQTEDNRLRITATFTEGDNSESYTFFRELDADVQAEATAEAEIYKQRFAALATPIEVPAATQALVGTTIQVS